MDEVQKKIKCVRMQYTRERQKVKKRKSGDGADDIYTSKWIHFQRLGFLDDFITAKRVFQITTRYNTYNYNRSFLQYNIYDKQNPNKAMW